MALLKVFTSYSHQDARQMKKLQTHLAVLHNMGNDDESTTYSVEFWNDQQISAGQDWEPAIEQAMSDATVSILLISANFLNSNFILKKEVPTLLERRKNEDMKVVPILAKACAWEAEPWLRKMQIRPQDAKPVWRSGGRYADEELALIVMEIWGFLKQAFMQSEQDRRAAEQAIAAELDKSRGVLASLWQQSRAMNNDFAKATREAERQRQQMERWRILEDTQKKIFEIQRDVTANRAEIMDKAYKKWDEYIKA